MKLVRCVITGSMCSGKTTVLSELSKEFLTFPEHARELIKKIYGNSKKIQRDIFQREIFKRRLEDFNNARGICFFDQGLIDGLAYYLMDGVKMPLDMLKDCKKFKYDLIFFLEPLDFYQKDNIRKENKEQQKKLAESIIKIYAKLGYKIIKVPFMPVEERVKFIKQKVMSNL